MFCKLNFRLFDTFQDEIFKNFGAKIQMSLKAKLDKMTMENYVETFKNRLENNLSNSAVFEFTFGGHQSQTFE